MKKAFFVITTLILLGYLGYEHSDNAKDHYKLLVHNPSDAVLNANLPSTDEMYTFNNENYGQIILFAGTEPKYGLRHILARHTENYFVNFDNKNDATLFEQDVSGNDIILGIKEFYKHCVDVDAYNNRVGIYSTYVGYTHLANKNVKCLLVIKDSDKSIITFYPLKKIKIDKIKEEIWKEIESEKEEQRKRDRYIYD